MNRRIYFIEGVCGGFILDKKKLELFMSVLLILCACILAGRGWERASSDRVRMEEEHVVVIDAGHGGIDPGKIGVDDCLEKDINLSIAKKVKAMLQQQDVKVVMTREGDAGLYDEQASNKKAQDMKRRCALINETAPDCVVSIHQNSYHEENVTGAQVFYYGTSEEGKRLAEILQLSLIERADPKNHRRAKANKSYYLLKKTEAPIVIAECGFLSNWEEAKKLQENEYQNKIAWAVTLGIMEYISEE